MPQTIEINDSTVAELATRLGLGDLDGSTTAVQQSPGNLSGLDSRFDVPDWCARFGLPLRGTKQDGSDTLYILERCEFDPSHKGKDAAIKQEPSGRLGYKCFHDSCKGRTWKELRRKYEPDYDKPNAKPAASTYITSTNTAVERSDKPISYQRITAAELDEGDYRTDFLIDGTLVAGQPLIIAGGKKCLKTNILLDAAISLATATPMLGTLAVSRGCRVLVMSGESGLATIQETCRRICRAKERTLNSVPGLIFSPDLPRIGDIRHLDALEKMIVGDEIEALFVDPAYLCMDMDGREGSLFAAGDQLNGLSKVCANNGVTLGLCHHTKKGLVDPFAPPELEHIAWAGFQEFARQWWLLGRRERFDPDSDGVHKLWFNVGGSAGFASLWAVDITEGKYPAPRRWEVTVSHASEARDQAIQQQQATKANEKGKKHNANVEVAKVGIADALRGVENNTETIDNIRARSGCKGAAFDDAFAALLRAGKLTATEITRRNKQSYPAYHYEFNDQP